MDVFQYNIEGNKEKSGVHKQIEKLVPFSIVTLFICVFALSLIFTALLCGAKYSQIMSLW